MMRLTTIAVSAIFLAAAAGCSQEPEGPAEQAGKAIDESVEDLEWKGVPRARFLDFCERWGFTNLRDRPKRWKD